MNPKDIRLRIFLLTLFIITPVFLFVFYLNTKELANAKSFQIDQLKAVARLVATEHSRVVEGARQLLITLSVSEQIKSPGENCSKYLSEVLGKYQRYSNIGLTDIRGKVICSAINSSTPINVSDRYFFQRVLETKQFTVGEYSVSRTTNEPILTFGYPVNSSKGVFSGIIYTSLDLDWLATLSTNLEVASQTTILVLDRNGVILVGNPNLNLEIGQKISSQKLIDSLANKGGLVEDKSKVKGSYFYAYQQIEESDSSPYVVIGTPQESVYQKPYRNFRTNILISLIIASASLIAGWQIGNSLITHIVNTMAKVDQLKRDFVSLVSHQLRTPLTAIKYFSKIILSGSTGSLKAKQREFLNDISSSTDRLIFLVGTLLNISRLESGKIVPDLQRVSLVELVKNCQSNLKYLFKKKHLKFNLSSGRNVPKKVSVDPKLLSQVITNLITNAAKYSYPKTKIEVNITKNGKFVYVGINNKGFGISKSEEQFIFSKFFRSESASKADSEGSGLGLYLSKLIVEAHGGNMKFKTMPKNTISFFFTIPIQPTKIIL